MNLPFSAQLYCFLNSVTSPPVCVSCETPTKFKQFSFGFFEFCSSSCSANHESTRKKCETTCLQKYGHRNIAHGIVREKILKTFEERFDGHPSRTAQYWLKKRRTETERYGDEFFKTQDFQEKYKRACLEKFGVDHPMKCKEIVTRVIQTKYERGVYIDWQAHPELLEDYYWYKKIVGYYTEKTYRKHFYDINPEKHKRSRNGWHLDHVYPIIEGWKHGVEPSQMAHKNNLQMLWYRENQGKSGHTHMSVEEFFASIK